MLVGYIRVSSENDRQVFDLQYDALIKAGVDKRNIYQTEALPSKAGRFNHQNGFQCSS